MTDSELRNLNTAALAFMGDAVYEQAVRERILSEGLSRVDTLHRRSTRYVCAPAQAAVIRELFDELTQEEQALARRARNHRYHSRAKNADPMTYKWASAFEALVGYLHLSGRQQRLDWLLDRAFALIEEGTKQG
ncbi:MAG: ribonuclease III [Firmicutes bacterium]|nr:ribonuclease III [Bacillota bacterium]